MGAGQSIPTTLTHEKLFELTRDTRGVMNILLDYMLKEVTVRDFLALSNPTECKKYIVFMANNIHKFFYELQIFPTKDKKGVIAFRPVKEIISPPESLEQEKQSICLVLAYYYARIFQIYGALALTLVDDVSYVADTGLLRAFGEERKSGLLAPGQRTYVSFGGDKDAEYNTLPLEGGTIYATQLGHFNFLRSFLNEKTKSDNKFLTKYVGEGISRGMIYFERGREYDENGKPLIMGMEYGTTKQQGKFSIGYSGAQRYAFLNVTARQESVGSLNIVLNFGKLQYYKKGISDSYTTELRDDILTIKQVVIEADRPFRGSIIYKIRDNQEDINEYFNAIFNRIVPFVKQISESDDVTTAIKYGTTRATMMSEVGTTEELRLGRIIQNLTTTKPLGHCIARALQLLRNVPMKGEPALSYICKAKFLEVTHTTSTGIKTTVSRSGIPEPGTSIDTSPGMAALVQLFYDTIKIGSPKLEIGMKPGADGKSSFDQYTEFMKNMSRLFEGNKDAAGIKSNDMLRKEGLHGIKNRRDRELCGQVSDAITIPYDVATNVYGFVNKMFKIQLEHASKCGAIFKMLFDIHRDKSSNRYRISLSENIIKKGFPEIERINGVARKLLIDYYSNCEQNYVLGMDYIIKSKKQVDAPKPGQAVKPAKPTKPTQSANPVTTDAKEAKETKETIPSARGLKPTVMPVKT